MFSTFFVINPHAGNGRTGRYWPVLCKKIKKSIPQFNHSFTASPGDAVFITREALKKGFELIVAVGGDGTVNECANGFWENGQLMGGSSALGTLPAGRGCDLARLLGISSRPESALRHLTGPDTRMLDVGKATFLDEEGKKKTRYFANIANVGFVPHVVNFSRQSPKILGSRISYLYGTLIGILNYRALPVVYTVDGTRREIPLLNMIVANGSYFGSGMRAAPHAKPDDGLFDFVVSGKIGFFDFLRRIPDLYTGNHIKIPEIDFFRERILKVSPANEGDSIPVEMDGDTVGKLPATFEILPGALRFKV